MLDLSDQAIRVLGDAGSNIDDEDPDFWRRVKPLLNAVMAGYPVFDRDTPYLIDAIRRGAYSDANDPNWEMPVGVTFEVGVFDLGYDDPAAILTELQAITFDSDADAAAFVLAYIA